MRLNVVIDSNIFVDLAESRKEESQALLADWLQDSVRFCLTAEHYTEINRSEDRSLREKRRGQAAHYHRLETDPTEYREAKLLLAPLFPNLTTPQDRSDFQHIARALAAGAWAFVTRDEPMLRRADEVYARCGLSIVCPAHLIGHIDELLHEREYQRFRVAGTNLIFRRRASSADDDLIDAIKDHDEAKRHLREVVRPMLADPQRFECTTITDHDEEVLAFYVVERQQKFDHHSLVPNLLTSAWPARWHARY